jgi:hypothetical protein
MKREEKKVDSKTFRGEVFCVYDVATEEEIIKNSVDDC